jgi:environmental stress-induced protein Ves
VIEGDRVMTVQRFAIAHLLSMPWKNGGGATREIVCQPPGAGMDAFDWRISIATIDRPGPFSAFPGIARTIMLLEGCGVRLRSAQAGIDHRLDTPLMPFDFDGSTALDCDLLGGTSTDFNVMVRADRLASQCRVLHAAHALAPAPHGLLLAVAGEWTAQSDDASRPLKAGEGVWWADTPFGARLTPSGDGAVLIAVRIEPRQAPRR